MTKKKTLAEIAKKHLHLETLETRRSDSLDFHEVSVWGVKAALEEAFTAGKRAARQRQPKVIVSMQILQNITGDLLESLEDLLGFAEVYGPSHRATYEDWSEYFEVARAAIAKAKNTTLHQEQG